MKLEIWSSASPAARNALNSSTLKPRPYSTFHPFLRLPIELRLQIWGIAGPGPKIIVQHHNRDGSQKWERTGGIPGVLHACRESRNEFLDIEALDIKEYNENEARRERHPIYRFHHFIHPPWPSRRQERERVICASLDVDTLFLTGYDVGITVASSIDYLSRFSGFEKIKYLALNNGPAGAEVPGYGMKDMKNMFSELIEVVTIIRETPERLLIFLPSMRSGTHPAAEELRDGVQRGDSGLVCGVNTRWILEHVFRQEEGLPARVPSDEEIADERRAEEARAAFRERNEKLRKEEAKKKEVVYEEVLDGVVLHEGVWKFCHGATVNEMGGEEKVKDVLDALERRFGPACL